MSSFLRSCSNCAAHIVTSNGTGEYVRCRKCQAKEPTFNEWASAVKAGSLVYIQPYLYESLSRSKWVVLDRVGDEVTIQVLGLPNKTIRTTISQLAKEDLTPRPRYAL